MGESLECFFNVAGHGEGDVSFFVVPFKGDAYKLFCFHIGGDRVVLPEGVSQVIEVGQVGVLDEEVINYKGEDDGVGLMLE